MFDRRNEKIPFHPVSLAIKAKEKGSSLINSLARRSSARNIITTA